MGFWRGIYYRRTVPTKAEELPAWLSQELQTIQGAVRPGVSVDVSANYTVSPIDRWLNCDATAGGFTGTLPDATRVPDQTITVKKTEATLNVVTVQALNGTIQGSATKTLTTQWASITLYSDGSAWYIFAVT